MRSPGQRIHRNLSQGSAAVSTHDAHQARIDAPRVVRRTVIDFSSLSLLQDRAPEKRKAAGQALAKTFKDNERTFALITNTLAKDKEIYDRWSGFQYVADSRHLNNRVES